jgi:hypothetical protein
MRIYEKLVKTLKRIINKILTWLETLVEMIFGGGTP